MATPVHMISASVIALKFAGVAPGQTDYILWSLVFSGMVDLDHIFFIIRDFKFYMKNGFRGNLHKARSIMHELVGVIIWSILALIIYFFDKTMATIFFVAMITHLTQDFLTGTSMPFTPFDKREIKMFEFTFQSKVITNILVVIGSIGLWYLYLSGRL